MNSSKPKGFSDENSTRAPATSGCAASNVLPKSMSNGPCSALPAEWRPRGRRLSAPASTEAIPERIGDHAAGPDRAGRQARPNHADQLVDQHPHLHMDPHVPGPCPCTCIFWSQVRIRTCDQLGAKCSSPRPASSCFRRILKTRQSLATPRPRHSPLL